MRGKGVLPFRVLPFRGITPAYAGKSLISQAPDRSRQDHPRLCGEKYLVSYHTVGAAGSPPPMRGKVTEAETVTKEDRITPAYAGKSPAGFSQYRDHWDHPRLCGEKSDRSATCFFKSGSPPPMRGKVRHAVKKVVVLGITPAYAGKSSGNGNTDSRRQDHPRLCGEKDFDVLHIPGMGGSPPPMRGKAYSCICPSTMSRITPAYAGKSICNLNLLRDC